MLSAFDLSSKNSRVNYDCILAKIVNNLMLKSSLLKKEDCRPYYLYVSTIIAFYYYLIALHFI